MDSVTNNVTDRCVKGLQGKLSRSYVVKRAAMYMDEGSQTGEHRESPPSAALHMDEGSQVGEHRESLLRARKG